MNIIKNGCPLKSIETLLEEVKHNTLLNMITTAERKLNPLGYHLSSEAKKRLRWLYVLYHEQVGNVTKSANKLGLSREWLSKIKNEFEKGNRDPKKLEPKSKAPHDTSQRKRISKETENKILEVRVKSKNVWGKVKIQTVLKRDCDLKVNPNTINKYLHKHRKIDPLISLKNSQAWQAKLARENPSPELRVKYRPPKQIKDYAPGALIEKDMKYVAKSKRIDSRKIGDNFYNQHTEIDTFTRIRSLELKNDGGSDGSNEAHRESIKKFPFRVACTNTDNGSENNGLFREQLKNEDVFQFYSNVGTPTDNPRVERSHLTDELEFYSKGGIKGSFEEQKEALAKWEYFYNFKRPHQAPGNLTPMEFYQLWKRDSQEALKINEKWQSYLKKQRIRLFKARRIKRKEQVEALMKFIDAKLDNQKVEIKKAKLELINCELCSVA